ncbi:hypothetical protein N5C46_20440 [Rossellomorea vietnamensis]|uniref:Uncharacterized protein n=1 Tax=Rossellomorea vietnamensis TaxID=218284 RepID=A0ACD4C605_9BACI|nr:hypothetical protein [Rossellomorea vietnamensis]UXH43978.1 hypothetical protein N5C46_20440 [Rossellomorea vietnamensis]
MTNRQANSSIKGYNYQFLSSIHEIIHEISDASEFVIEGIEDLDINKEEESILVQYKYHELKNFQNSRVAKPLAIMFNHFLNNRQKKYKYRLFIYITDKLPNINITLLYEILSLDSGSKYISEDNKPFIKDSKLLMEFLEFFHWEVSLKYEIMEREIIELLIETYSISESSAEYFYLPNAFKIINDLAIKSDPVERTITKLWFKNTLSKYRKDLDFEFITRFKSFHATKKYIKNELMTRNIKKNTREFVVYIGNPLRGDLSSFIINLAKKFYYSGNRNDTKPVTFVVNGNKEEIMALKKNIYSHLSNTNELIIMNDGYEDYRFNSQMFNCAPFTVALPLRGKVNIPNYNFKMIRLNTFSEHKRKINLIAPVVISIDGGFGDFEEHYDYFSLRGLKNDEIIELLGGN